MSPNTLLTKIAIFHLFAVVEFVLSLPPLPCLLPLFSDAAEESLLQLLSLSARGPVDGVTRVTRGHGDRDGVGDQLLPAGSVTLVPDQAVWRLADSQGVKLCTSALLNGDDWTEALRGFIFES